MRLSAPVPLAETHDVSAFDCGDVGLNHWLVHRALAHQASGAARTFVVCAGSRVVGYYAIAAGSVSRETAVGAVRRNMPDPVPMALLGRLAVDVTAQGKGLGAGMLKDAVMRVHQAAATLGIRGILVDALNEDAAAFYGRFGFRPAPGMPLKLMVTLAEVNRIVG